MKHLCYLKMRMCSETGEIIHMEQCLSMRGHLFGAIASAFGVKRWGEIDEVECFDMNAANGEVMRRLA